MNRPSLADAVLKIGLDPAGIQSKPPFSALAESIPPEAVTETPLRLAKENIAVIIPRRRRYICGNLPGVD